MREESALSVSHGFTVKLKYTFQVREAGPSPGVRPDALVWDRCHHIDSSQQSVHQQLILGTPLPLLLGLVGWGGAGPGSAVLWFSSGRPGLLSFSAPGQGGVKPFPSQGLFCLPS